MDPWKKGKSEVATKVSFVALSESFFDRLDIFSNARLLKITLVLLFFGEIHYLPSLRTSLGRELTALAGGSLFCIRNEPIWTETETVLRELPAKRGSKRR